MKKLSAQYVVEYIDYKILHFVFHSSTYSAKFEIDLKGSYKKGDSWILRLCLTKKTLW
jgi:hypothetical protein